MPLCAFLTLDDPTGYVVIDDDLTYQPLRELGWRVETVPWSRPDIAWDSYDAVVMRSTWDYIKTPDTFLSILTNIERAGTPLFNNLDLVRWNIQKTYLRDLAARGVPVVPTVWRDRLEPATLSSLLKEVGTDETVIKPVIGASASGAYRIDTWNIAAQTAAIETYYADRALMVQPFLSAVTSEGEFSLFYFNGVHSHTILKAPKAEDFRVQQEHGGSVCLVQADNVLRAAGDAVLRALDEAPLYARTDFVRADNGRDFWLMELELIEPSLYFRMDPNAPERFARALHQRVSL
jgi:glutathione synthase/RimK-type ligase-like ATP-grasp enzyme